MSTKDSRLLALRLSEPNVPKEVTAQVFDTALSQWVPKSTSPIAGGTMKVSGYSICTVSDMNGTRSYYDPWHDPD